MPYANGFCCWMQVITMAYYPDVRQETLLAAGNLSGAVDLMHMMTYDQGGGHHSTYKFAETAAQQGVRIFGADQAHKLTLGLPFYGRHSGTGEWTTYEDLVQHWHPLKARHDRVPASGPANAFIGFNGVDTIHNKTRLAARLGLGGVMIWEVGQDCRLVAVTHGSTTHVRTCPEDKSSLLLAIDRGMRKAKRARAPGPAVHRAATGDKDEL